jgi:hypothetical protein
VREKIDLIDLLRVAEHQEEALKYLLDNFSYYKKDYEKEENKTIISNIAFIPVRDEFGEKRKVKRSEASLISLFTKCSKTHFVFQAFWNTSCQVMGFWIVQDPFRTDVAKLGVSEHPEPLMLISRLRHSPPQLQKTAISQFDYLSLCCAFAEENLLELSSLPFVPIIVDEERGNIKCIPPKNCYLGKAEFTLYSKLFDFVNFGNRANSFLKDCKAKEEPTVDDVANALATDPQAFLIHSKGRDSALRQ